MGVSAKLDFPVPEGAIRAEAVVEHLIPGGGVGLKFTAITDRDGPNLVAPNEPDSHFGVHPAGASIRVVNCFYGTRFI